MSYLHQSLAQAISPNAAKRLATLDLHTVADLLWHIPRRYQHPGELTDISSAPLDEPIILNARIVDTRTIPMRSRRGTIMKATITDGTSEIEATFFLSRRALVDYYRRLLTPGVNAIFSGKLSHTKYGLQLVHPKLERYDGAGNEQAALAALTRTIAIYPMSAKTPGPFLSTCIETVLAGATSAEIGDLVPAAIRAKRHMPTLVETFRAIHALDEDADPKAALADLKFTEAFVLNTLLAKRRHQAQGEPAKARPATPDGWVAAFDAQLPFALTAGQRAVGDEISADLSRPVPMMRLLQGDVGSGKTIVALRAMLQVVDTGGQAALLAPTEVLAYQHYRTICHLLGDLTGMAGEEGKLHVELVTGTQHGARRRQSRAALAGGVADLVVGTHALLSPDVQFADLALAVVDEQHRFGVEQRDELRHAGGGVHMLHMTATPIPRTVALMVFGDLDTSLLTQAPTGRAGVQTFRVPEDNAAWMERMYARLAEEIGRGGRVFVVCARIDRTDPAGDEDRQLHAVLDMVDHLRAQAPLAGVTIGTLHGRMKPAEKDAAMADFIAGTTQLLVSTTVIEVGVDVPEATAMVVWDADRFGLAQLHQLRGRIGRGDQPGICFIVDPGESTGELASQRLSVFASTTNGFTLAEADVALRKEGDVLGAKQSGLRSGLRTLSAVRDAPIIEAARDAAGQLIAANPELRGETALIDAISQLQAAGEYLERT